jgi:catechol 2,3-dioxygenase-like lactoylglutathione lyase family enzyme
MPADAKAHIRIARPSRDLQAAERFWTSGLDLKVLYRHAADGVPGQHSLLMVGWPDAAWHLELVHDPAAPMDPRPTPEDLLVNRRRQSARRRAAAVSGGTSLMYAPAPVSLVARNFNLSAVRCGV